VIVVDAGKMRDRIEIQEPKETADAYGAAVRSWVTIATVWAEVKPLESVPLPDDAQSMGVQYEIKLRYFKGLSHRYRLRFPGTNRTLDINGVIDEGNYGVQQVLDCLEKIKRA
jgi:SPP1 family predicted phage head-tail adaptor